MIGESSGVGGDGANDDIGTRKGDSDDDEEDDEDEIPHLIFFFFNSNNHIKTNVIAKTKPYS